VNVPRSRRVLTGFAGTCALLALATVAVRPMTAPNFSDVRARYVPSDAVLLDRQGEILDTQRIDYTVRRLAWTPLEEVSPALVEAIIEAEDRRFWRHDGVDWLSVAGALRDQLFNHRRRGASTITMQLASLLESRPRSAPRGFGEKLHQARVARGLEQHWTKPEILEAYLNLLHFRGELQGIRAASEVLAGKVPSGLSVPESTVLAALLPNPSASPDRVAERGCARASHSVAGPSCAEIKGAATTLLSRVAEPVASERLAPHLAHALLRRPGERLATTIDGAVQRLARDALRRQLAELSARNVRDGAALVVDNATGDVFAYIGSGGPNSSAPEVDGVRAGRQAGSTLKPFLYELALERRYLTAASLLDDSPLNIDTANGIYLPQDYDHDYKGTVSMRTALASSLNVPAVRTLMMVGVDAFRDRLHSLGYEGIAENGEYYGYSLALGSAEVSLWEQAQAYRTLAREGLSSTLRVRADDPRPAPRSALPSDASFVIGDVLNDRSARVGTFGLDSSLSTDFWSAVKTGTSKDMRDNWCVGYTAAFTVAV
jgi:penicillin-binding protein 1C